MMDMDRIGKVKPGRPIDLFTIGRVYVDIQYFVDELPQPNKAGEILEIYQGCGGCPGNVAVAASRLGLTTAVCAMVGSDVYGTRYIEQLKRENVDVSPMRQDPEKPTGMSVILMDAQGIPAIVRRLGANTELFFDDVDADRLLQAKWLHMAAASNPSVLEEASTLAKENGIVTSFDPGRSMSRKGYQALKTIWDNTDVVIVNREEAGNLVDITYDRLNFAEITEKLFDVEVVDTLGAGDAFDAGVITGLLGGQPLRASVVYGNAVAALKIGRKGTQSLPTRSDVESFLTRWT
jgi:ribokinase